MTYRYPFNFDVKEEKVIELKDMFQEDADYVEIISNEIKKQIESKNLKDSFIEPFEEIKEDQDFYITEDDIVIYFSLYEYTSYAAGFPEFTIKRDELPFLKEEYR